MSDLKAIQALLGKSGYSSSDIEVSDRGGVGLTETGLRKAHDVMKAAEARRTMSNSREAFEDWARKNVAWRGQ